MATFEQYLAFNGDEIKQRQLEIYQNTQLSAFAQKAISAIKREQHWLLMAEPRCPDCLVFVPFVQKMAELNPLIKLRYLSRQDYQDRALFDNDEQQRIVIETHNIPSLFHIDQAKTEVIVREYPTFLIQRMDNSPDQIDTLRQAYRNNEFAEQIENELTQIFTTQ